MSHAGKNRLGKVVQRSKPVIPEKAAAGSNAAKAAKAAPEFGRRPTAKRASTKAPAMSADERMMRVILAERLKER